METSSKLKHARISAQKARLVADQIRGLPVERAMDLLDFSVKRAAKMIKRVLVSAVANAEHNKGMDVDTLFVDTAIATQGPTMKRIRPRAQGRAFRIEKKSSHFSDRKSNFNFFNSYFFSKTKKKPWLYR